MPQDPRSCNDGLAGALFGGLCLDGQCRCHPGFVFNPATGHCRAQRCDESGACGPSACTNAIALTAGAFSGTTDGGVDAYGGGSSCVPGGAPDQVFSVTVPAGQRVLLKAQAAFVARLFLLDPKTCTASCVHDAASDGQFAKLAWFNNSTSPVELPFLLDWNAGLPNPSAIPNSGPYTVTVAFDSGPTEGESCLWPAPLSLDATTEARPGVEANDEGPFGMGENVYRLTVPAKTTLDLDFVATGSSRVVLYDHPESCGTSDSVASFLVLNSMGTVRHSYSNGSAEPVTLTVVVEPFGVFETGAVDIVPTLTPH